MPRKNTKPLPVIRNLAVAKWRRKHRLDWVGNTVLAFSAILEREGIPYLWVGDVALQELGLEFMPECLDLLVNRGGKAILALREISFPQGGRKRTNVLVTYPAGAIVRVWDTTSSRGHVTLTRRSGMRIATLREALHEQRLLAEHTPSLEMEHRVRALEALTALKAKPNGKLDPSPSHTSHGTESLA